MIKVLASRPSVVLVAFVTSGLWAAACEPGPTLEPLADGGDVGGATTTSTQGTGATGTGPSGAGATGTGPSGTGGGGTACGYAAPTYFTLPAGFAGPLSGPPPFADVGGTELCASGVNVPTFSLVDMTADGRPDLLVTETCGTNLGSTQWWVYPNTGTGFASPPTSFALPSGYNGATPSFPTTSGNETCSGGSNAPTFALVDLIADAKPDLLVMQSCTDATVGTTHWLVYENTGSGFATTGTPYPLPSGYGQAAFTSLGSLASCSNGAGSPGFVVADMNGDGKLDLLVTQSCTDSAIGTSGWLLYPGTDTGFTATPTTLTLPGGYAGATPVFASTQGALSCTGENAPEFTLADMNDDGLPDLVLTQVCNDTAIGTSSWRVYANEATGFAGSPLSWTLPPGFQGQANGGSPAVPFGGFSGMLACTGADAPAFTVVDVNGDGKLDLLVTERCNDTSVGATRWLAYEGTSTGFATIPTVVSLPGGYTTASTTTPPVFADDTGMLFCTGGADVPEFALVPLTHDLLPDIVVSRRCNDTTTGTTAWLVDTSTCH